MGRLIDADELIVRLRNESIIPFSKMLLNDEHRWFIKLEDMIKTQPTAYDVEKVVAELDNKMLDSLSGKAETVTGMNGILASQYSGEVSAYEKAIEIVKKGGAT